MAKTNVQRKGLSNITQKEFMDHIKGGRFIIVFVIFLLLSAYSLYQGIEMYHDQLDAYKESIVRIDEDRALAEEKGIAIPPYLWMPERPPVLSAFMMMSMAMPILGGMLAVIMGFDLISKERQDRTLKTLLSHPIYRDEIINGKAIGGMLTIVVAIGVTLAISIAILLISDIVPTVNEFLSIGLFGIISIVVLVSFFAIALMASVLFKSGGNSILFALGVMMVIGLILPLIGGFAADIIVGPPPEMPEMVHDIHIPPPPAEEPGEDAPAQVIKFDPAMGKEWEEWTIESAAHWDRRMAITEIFGILNPGTHFGRISAELGFRGGFGMGFVPPPVGPAPVAPGVDMDVDEAPGILDKLGAVWMNILALFIMPTVFFAVAYTKFMRLDIR